MKKVYVALALIISVGISMQAPFFSNGFKLNKWDQPRFDRLSGSAKSLYPKLRQVVEAANLNLKEMNIFLDYLSQLHLICDIHKVSMQGALLLLPTIVISFRASTDPRKDVSNNKVVLQKFIDVLDSLDQVESERLVDTFIDETSFLIGKQEKEESDNEESLVS